MAEANRGNVMPSRDRSKPGSRKGGLRSLAFVGILILSRSAAAGPTFVVNSLADVPAGPNTTDGICETATGNGVCTLRAAIMEANATQDSVVRVPAGRYALSRASTPGFHPENGDLDVRAPMKIEGDGPSVTVIDGNALARVFFVDLGPNPNRVEMRGLSVQNGLAPTNDEGGGLLIAARVLLENVHIQGNTARRGGGISMFTNTSSLTLRHGIVEGNVSTSEGGGIAIDAGASVLVEDSLIQNNFGANGGGIVIDRTASARLDRTALIGNSAFDVLSSSTVGGGITTAGDLLIVNSVVWGSGAGGAGAGLHVQEGTATLIHVTLTANVGWQRYDTPAAQEGSGLFVEPGANVTLDSSIVTSNLDRDGAGEFPTYRPSDCSTGVLSLDYNLVGSAVSCPLAGQLAHVLYGSGFQTLDFNGGFARDIASDFTPAQAAIPAASCLDSLGAPLATDFRGHRRSSTSCDIGAHEAEAIYKPAEVLGVNLLRNGGATGEELGLAASIANPTNVELYQAPYWQQSGKLVQLLYGSPGLPGRNNAPTGSGYKFLSGGNDPTVNATQLIDVSALAAQIDAGTLPYRVAGSFGGRLTANDSASLQVYFFSPGFGFLGVAPQLGGFTAADRANQTKLIFAQGNGTVPAGTRMIQVALSFQDTNGGTNDGYADGLSVTLPEPNLAASLGAALIALAGVARQRTSRSA